MIIMDNSIHQNEVGSALGFRMIVDVDADADDENENCGCGCECECGND